MSQSLKIVRNYWSYWQIGSEWKHSSSINLSERHQLPCLTSLQKLSLNVTFVVFSVVRWSLDTWQTEGWDGELLRWTQFNERPVSVMLQASLLSNYIQTTLIKDQTSAARIWRTRSQQTIFPSSMGHPGPAVFIASKSSSIRWGSQKRLTRPVLMSAWRITFNIQTMRGSRLFQSQMLHLKISTF